MSSTLPQLSPDLLKTHLSNKNLLIVGGTAGLGRALAISALKRGAKVTVVGRRDPDAELTAAGAQFVKKDLSLMKNALALAEEVDVKPLDTIVFTVGIITYPERRATEEGIEVDMAVSYLSRFVFSRAILAKGFGTARQNKEEKPRIFVMGYPGTNLTPTVDDFNSEKSYASWGAHMNTVAGNEALVHYLNKEFQGNANAYGLNPGMVRTEIRDNLLGKGSWKSWLMESLVGLFTWTPASYAESTINVIVSPELEKRPGAFINNSRKIIPGNPFFSKEENVARVLSETVKLADRALNSDERRS